MNLKYFIPSNGTYAGNNYSQFLKLEFLIDNYNSTNTKPPHLALFGEASVGKTTSAKNLAKFLNYNFYNINATTLNLSNFTDSLFNIAGSPIKYLTKDKKIVNLLQDKTIILIDEAHDLDKKIQTLFLTILDNPSNPIDILGSKIIDCSDVIWVFATTDSSKLIQPLVSRLDTIYFQQYSIEDVKHIIKLSSKKIDDECGLILAACSKSIPRVAIRYAKQIESMNKNISNIGKQEGILFAKKYLNMDSDGIDGTDHRIILYLSNNKKGLSMTDLISLEINKNNIKLLSSKNNLSSSEYKALNRAKCIVNIIEIKERQLSTIPKSRQDISLACRILDLKELEIRLSYLEQLNMVKKTAHGIILNKE